MRLPWLPSAAEQHHSGTVRLTDNWAVSVSGTWRIVFRFEGRNVTDVNLLDYQ